MLLTWSASSGLNPTLSLDFLTPVLDGRITASGGANGTRVNSSGLIVAATTPRFDYDPVTLAIKGLLVEEARTNLFLNSKIDGSNLSTQGVSVTAQAYTISFYGTGSITLSGAATATINGAGAYPNRVTSTFTPSAGTLTCTVAGTVQYAQIEVGSLATSFIPTAGSTVTRTADSLTMTGSNFSSWFNATEGTFVTEHMTAGVEGTRAVCEANNNTVDNRIGTYYFASLNVNAFIIDGGSSAAFGGTSFTANTPTLSALAYKAGDYALCTRGQAVSGNAFATVPSVDQLGIGGSAAVTSEYMNGWLRSLRYYPRRLTNAQLQVLT